MDSEQEVKKTKAKQLRARKLGALTRLRRRAFVMIDTCGSKTELKDIHKELDAAVEKLSEVNDEYILLVNDAEEKKNAEKYMQDAEQQHADALERIKDHLLNRKDEAPSAVPSKHSSVKTTTSQQSNKSKDAEIIVKVMEMRAAQVEQRLIQEREEQELQRQRKLQEVKDEVDLAKLEARLRKEAEDELSWDRRNDFEGEEEAIARDLDPQEKGDAPTRRADRRSMPSHCPMAPRSIPKLSLPNFDGNPLEWPRWFGLFKALIHDQPLLSETEKMAHLQSVVHGVAQQAISGLLFDPKLYPEAIEVLKTRFGREQEVVQSHLEAIFSSPSPVVSSVGSMERFCGTVNSTITVLQKLGFVGDLSSTENLRRMLDKLPRELGREWGKHIVEHEIGRPTLIEFNKWLEKQREIAVNCACTPAGAAVFERRQPVRRSANTTLTTNTVSRRCCCCNGDHYIQECSSFQTKLPDERLQVVTEGRLCFSCLRKGHRSRDCWSARPCEIVGCQYRHHGLLHGARLAAPRSLRQQQQQVDDTHEEATRRTIATVTPASSQAVTLLQVVPIRVHGPEGSFLDTFALLDPGSETSLCTTSLIHTLGLVGTEQRLSIDNVEGSGAERTSTRVTLEVSPGSHVESGAKIGVHEAFSVPRLNVRVPEIPAKERKS